MTSRASGTQVEMGLLWFTIADRDWGACQCEHLALAGIGAVASARVHFGLCLVGLCDESHARSCAVIAAPCVPAGRFRVCVA